MTDRIRWGRGARYLLPPLLWMAFIFAMSTDRGSSANTRPVLASILRGYLPSLAARMPAATVDRIDFAIRKGSHVTEYAILGFLLLRALQGLGKPEDARRRVALAWFVAVAYAASDEWHQSFVPSRGATPVDVLYDAFGSTLGVFVRSRGAFVRSRR